MSLKEKILEFRDKRPGAFQASVVALLIVAALLIFAAMMTSREEVTRQRMTLPAPRVNVKAADVGPTRVRITGEGTVSPLREIDLVPQVGGRVVFMSPDLVDGGMFEKGDVLFRIDPVDYELAVKAARARVKDLESKLMLTEEEAEAADEPEVIDEPVSEPAMTAPKVNLTVEHVDAPLEAPKVKANRVRRAR